MQPVFRYDFYVMTKPFWDEGIRFQCQGTGRCCTARGTYGYVYLTLADRRRLAKHFKIPTVSFTKKHCTKTNGHFHLKDFKRTCDYLKGTGCTVYDARPTQCRTWPFWPENMNARAWNHDVVSFCPGVGKGRLYTKAEIQKLLKQDPVS